MKDLKTCVGREGEFVVGIHRPCFEVRNLREKDCFSFLGQLEDGTEIDNRINFPENNVYEPGADLVYEIPNPFPFRGTTYINSAWADKKAGRPESIFIPEPSPCSLFKNFDRWSGINKVSLKEKESLLDLLPRPLLIALAQSSTDSKEISSLAQRSCRIIFDRAGKPSGIGYRKSGKTGIMPDIRDDELFEVVVNNRYLPDEYKEVMVLRPGVQGANEITGDYTSECGKTHVFEYLRRNSYIPWGHFASNMANDAVRYSSSELCPEDMKGLRNLYYQRVYARLAAQMDITFSFKRKGLSEDELENLRKRVLECLVSGRKPEFNSSLWGWNLGFGYSHSGYRLNASHQMIHHQNAMIPGKIRDNRGNDIPSFACGDLIDDFTKKYRKMTGRNFFANYLKAVKNNKRTDGKNIGESSLVILEDDNIILFVPKAQVCEWEIQLMPKKECGNILEADTGMRNSFDSAILAGMKVLESLGARMITSIEFSKRFDSGNSDQRLLYSFIPKLPHAPETFSEVQLRWIGGAYPEDFAHACRKAVERRNIIS